MEEINIYSTVKNGYKKLSNILNGTVFYTINNKEFEFKTVEHLYQSLKALYFKDEYTANKIYRSNTGWDAQKLSKTIEIKNDKTLEDWDTISEDILEKCMRLCFEQNPKALELLLSTGNSKLIHDSGKHINLGKWATVFPNILMKIRKDKNNNPVYLNTNEINEHRTNN